MTQSREEWRKQVWEEKFDFLAEQWKEILGLGHWVIHWIMSDPIDDDTDTEAQCKVRTELGHQAWITIADRVAEEPESYRERTIVHELLHIKFDELFHFLACYLADEHFVYFRRLVEIAVEDLATVLIELVRSREEGDAESLSS